MLPRIDYSEMPAHKLFPPRHPKIAEAEKAIAEMVSDPRGRLLTAIHEAGHAVQYRKLGIAYAFGGPSVFHDCSTDTFFSSCGSTQIRDKDFLKLAAEDPEKLAKVLVAGRVAERVLMGVDNLYHSEMDFSDFIYFAKGRSKSELVLLWKQTEEEYFREMSEDLNEQKEIVHEAARFSEKIFGVDPSVREVSNTPPRSNRLAF
jgi:hypothetical protein